MKILFVVEWFFPRSGLCQVAFDIATELSRVGHEVTLITTDYDFDHIYASILEKKGVKIIVFKHILNLSNFVYSPSMKDWLDFHLEDYDIIHMHDFRTYQNIIVYYYSRKLKKHYILQAHGSLPYFKKSSIKKIFDSIWGKRILKNASRVVALTETEAEQYLSLGVDSDKIAIIPNGTDCSKYDKLPLKGVFKYKQGINSEDYLILYLGRLHKTKGIDLLILAFKDLIDRLKNIKLVIVGPDSGLESHLKHLVNKFEISNDVLFIGPLYEDDKLEVFVDADVFVTPSFSGFPMTFLESCACGTPIITTNNGDKLDWINNQTGIVTDYDKTALMNAILKVLNDKELKERFGYNGIKLAKSLNWTKISKEYEFIYRESIKKT